MNNGDPNNISDKEIKETNMIDKSSGGGLGFTSSAPPEIPQAPQKPEPKPSKDKEQISMSNSKKLNSKKDSTRQKLMKGKFGLQSYSAPIKPVKPVTKTKGKK